MLPRAFRQAPRPSRVSLVSLVFGLLLTLSGGGCETNYPPPPFLLDHYPDQAKRQGLTGRVGLEYTVDNKGRRQDIVVLESGGRLFDKAAEAVVSDAHVRIPPDPATSESGKRYRVGVIFELRGRAKVAAFEDGRETVVLIANPGG